MFTGIVEEMGTIVSVKKGVASSVLTISFSSLFDDLKLGDSVAVDGVCLTVSTLNATSFCADVMHETLNYSTLGTLVQNNRVNLERAMQTNGRFGGHIVSGHIDGRGTIAKIVKDDNAIRYTIRAEKEILNYIVSKGSIAINGISLTVASLGQNDFTVSVIPHTAEITTLSLKSIGDAVNLENDVIGKYVGRLLGLGVIPRGFSGESGGGSLDGSPHTGTPLARAPLAKSPQQDSKLTEEFLMSKGFF